MGKRQSGYGILKQTTRVALPLFEIVSVLVRFDHVFIFGQLSSIHCSAFATSERARNRRFSALSAPETATQSKPAAMEFIAGETYAGESEESLTAAKMQKPPAMKHKWLFRFAHRAALLVLHESKSC